MTMLNATRLMNKCRIQCLRRRRLRLIVGSLRRLFCGGGDDLGSQSVAGIGEQSSMHAHTMTLTLYYIYPELPLYRPPTTGVADGNGDDNDYGDDDTCLSRRRAMNSSKFVEFSFSLSTLCAALPVSIPSDTKLTAVFVACVALPRVLV